MTSFAQNGLLLDVQHVTMRFGGITAVNDLSMRIPTGSITGLIGPNGAGKTTAFNVISGFYNPQEGDILFKGPQREGLPAAPDLQGGHGPDLPEHPALRQRNRAGKRHGRLSGPPQEPVVDARLSTCPAHGARKRKSARGEGPHPPPRARFLHERKGVEPALRSAAAP